MICDAPTIPLLKLMDEMLDTFFLDQYVFTTSVIRYIPISGLFLDFQGRNTRRGFLHSKEIGPTAFLNRNMVVHINDHKDSPPAASLF